MYQRLPSFVLGFHGTDEDTVKSVLNNADGHLKQSQNLWDWLGDGIYFWENDPVRALAFAKESMHWKRITDKRPAVIGAVIDLGLCLNLFDQPAILEVANAATSFKKDMRKLGVQLPRNEGRPPDKVKRHLDRAVIQHMHALREKSPLTPRYQTVRAGFHEGKAAFPGSGIKSKNHIQIAVIDPTCVKGYFLPRTSDYAGLDASA